MKRIAEYLAVFAVAAVVFAVTSFLWSGLVAALIAATVAAAVAVALWRWFIQRNGDPGADLDVPLLGSIPDHADAGPAPAMSSTSHGYTEIADVISELANTQVLLVTSPAPGQGTTTTALNLAIASSHAGRRVLLVDADRVTSTLSQYNGTGLEPGLYDIAKGSAGLEDAARMWHLGGDTRMPMIPIGSEVGDETDLASAHLAGVIDRVGERADLIIIDAPSVTFDGVPRELAAHADGSLLVLPPNGSKELANRARSILADIGAPLVGYVLNRGKPSSRPTGWRMFRRFTATVVLLMAAYGAWTGVSIWTKWLGVDREQVDTTAARADIAAAGPATNTASDPDGLIRIEDLDPGIIDSLASVEPVDTEFFETYLVLGTDTRSPGGSTGRADVIIMVLVPNDGSDPGMVSLPRDLFLPNACTSGYSRINAGLNGCGSTVSGMELISINIEDFTGVGIDHVALFDFEGFERIIDAVGGVEICVTNPVRSGKADLELSLPAGCGVYDGETALKWVRSRQTQELVNGTWRTMQGVNDLTRNQRQQDVIIEMFSKLQDMRNPSDLAAVVGELSDAFTLDESIGIGEAVSLAWSLRDIGSSGFNRFSIPVTGHVTSTGSQVLLPTTAFVDLVTAQFPSYSATSAAP